MHTCQLYRDSLYSFLAVLYRELLHSYRDLSLEKIDDCESNNVYKCLHSQNVAFRYINSSYSKRIGFL